MQRSGMKSQFERKMPLGLRLTRKFVEDRLLALQAPVKEEARRFVQLHGEAHLQQVRAWFEQAYRALQQASPCG